MARSPWTSIPVGVVAALGFSLFPADWASSAPKGFQLKSGSASPPAMQGNEHVIQNSNGAVIDWSSFSIARSETVRFAQDHARSCVINRVREGAPSEILGNLLSNGQVYLINPYGIFIGGEAYIETAGFIASTLDLFEGDLEQRFKGESLAKLHNEGAIVSKEGYVYLIAHDVENSGRIEAPKVGLLAGADVLIRPDGAPVVRIKSEEGFDPDLLEKNPYALAIRHSGRIRADEVHVAGGDVRLAAGSHIDVSGDAGGGKAFIGRSATTLTVEKGALVSANALERGDGGEVIFWSDGFTNYHGHTEIRGGPLGGNGGFVEVSGVKLGYHGTVDSLSLGRPGSVLLDPTDITISGSGNSGGSFIANDWTSTAATANIDVAGLVALLDGPNNVTISTYTETGGPFANAGSITVSSAIVWSSASTLTLVADRNIAINANITNTGTSMGTFTAMDFTAWGFDDSEVTYHGIDIATGVTVSATEGAIVMYGESSSTATNSFGVRLSGTAALSTTTGSITVSGLGGQAAASFGIQLAGSTSISATNGTITLYGEGRSVNSNSNYHFGIQLRDGSVIETTGSGNIFISAIAGATTGLSNFGIEITGDPLCRIEASGSGNITFEDCIGAASSPASTVVGGLMLREGEILANSGTITFRRCHGPNSSVANNYGFSTSHSDVNNATTTIRSTSGAIVFDDCVGKAATNSSIGVNLEGASTNRDRLIEAPRIIFTNISGGSAPNSTGVRLGLLSSINAGAGGIEINATAGPAATNGAGYRQDNGTMTTTSGTISITASSFGDGQCRGILWTAGNLSSTSGNIVLSGVSLGTGTSAIGVQISGAHDLLTTGALIFTNCVGGPGAGNRGIIINPGNNNRVQTGGEILATNNILAGTGAGGFAFDVTGDVNGGLRSLSGTISIRGVASSLNSRGIGASGVIDSTGGGNIELTGIAYSPSGTSSFGIESNATGRVQTTGTGNITFTGQSSSFQAPGIRWLNCNTGSTTGTLSFIDCLSASTGGDGGVEVTGIDHDGTVTFVNCVGGRGVIIRGATITGDLIATNNIAGRSGLFIGSTTVAVGGLIDVIATATATSGNAHGISIDVASLQTTGSGDITLIGYGGPSSSNSHGVALDNVNASIISNSGNITLKGTSRGTSGASRGVVIRGPVSSTSGAITITGVSTATGGSCTGVFVGSQTWNTGATTATLTFLNCSTESGTAIEITQSLVHLGDVLFTNCFSGGGIGVSWTGGSVDTTIDGNLIATNAISGFGGGWVSGSTITVSGDLSITASGFGSNTASHGISVTAGLLETTTGSITLNGTGGASSTASHGINVTGGAIITDSGAVSLTGGASGTAASHGILLAADNAVQSTSGAMTLSGASSSSNSSSRGVQVSNAWSTGTTTANLTFQNCTGAAGNAVSIEQSLTHQGNVILSDCFSEAGIAINWTGTTNVIGTSSVGDLIATNNISGGGGGWASTGTLTVEGSIAIKASGSGTAVASHGVSITGGRLQTAAGSIALTGIGGASSVVSHGINQTAGLVISDSGAISYSGNASGSALNYGVFLSGANPIQSTSGAITVSGISTGSVADAHGVITSAAWNTGTTTAELTFDNCFSATGNAASIEGALTHADNVVFTDCVGGSRGVFFTTATHTISGDLIATQNITGVITGFRNSGTLTVTGDIAIIASATSTSAAANGIDFNENLMSSTGGAITLIGSSAPSSTNSYGVQFINGRISSNAGAISVTGTASGSGVNHGVYLLSTNSIQSTSGAITISGSTSSDANGVLATAGWDTLTTGTLTFQNCTGSLGGVNLGSLTHDENVVMQDCYSGGGYAISLSATNSIEGSLTAVSAIFGGSSGFLHGGTTTVGTDVAIMAVASSTSGAAHGVHFTSGVMQTTTGTISLNGTGGNSATLSHGVYLDGGSVLTTSGPVLLTGSASGTNDNCGVFLNATNSVVSTSGAITVSGSASSPSAAAYGVYANGNWNAGATTATLTFVNSNGPSGAATVGNLTYLGSVLFSDCFSESAHGILLQGTNTISGSLIATNAISGGSAGFIHSGSTTIATNASISASGTATASASHGIHFSSGLFQTSGAGNITLSGIGGNSSTASHGVLIGTGTIASASGAISITGTASGSAVSHGVLLNATNAIQSASGAITLSGTSTASGASASGVRNTRPWNTGATTAALTFSGCYSPNSASGRGVLLAFGIPLTHLGNVLFTHCEGNAAVSMGQAAIGGSLIATDSIIGSSGGFWFTSAVTAAGNISIAASGASSFGIRIDNVVQTQTSSIISMLGIGESGTGIWVTSSGRVHSDQGDISLTGLVSDSGTIGMNLTSSSPVTSNSGNITLSGTGGSGAGVSGSTSNWDTLTTGTLTFSSCISPSAAGVSLSGTVTHDGNLVFTHCQGTSGVSLDGTFTIGGSLSATNTVIGTTNGWLNTANLNVTGSVAITAEGATSGARIEGPIATLGSSALAVSGVAGPSVSANQGIYLLTNGSLQSDSGNISLDGSVSGSSTGIGIWLISTNSLVSSSGAVTLSGRSTASGASSHGVALNGTTSIGTGGTLTFINCMGGVGSTSHGVHGSNSFTTAGNISAITGIVSGSGSGSVGFSLANTLSTSGANSSVQIIAESVATAGSVYGIRITGSGAVSAVNGDVLLNGTGGNSTSSHGVFFDGTVTAITTTGGAVSVIGKAIGTSGHGILISATNSITSTSGTITLSGSAIGSGSGLLINRPWAPNTIAPLIFSNCIGGAGAGECHAVRNNNTSTASPITLNGNLIATQNILGGTGSSANKAFYINSPITLSGTHTLQITATARGSGIESAGIFINSQVTLGSGEATLNGTGSQFAGNNAHGIEFDGGNFISSTSGTITLTGTARGTGSSCGIYATLSPFGTTTIAPIQMTGVSSAPGANSHGVLLGGIPFSYTGTISLTNCTGGANSSAGVRFNQIFSPGAAFALNQISGREGGADSVGVYFNATFTAAQIIGSNISGGASSSGGHGVYIGASVGNASPSSTAISLTAQTQGIGNSHGIFVDGGAISGGASGTITLNGTASGATGSNNGLFISNASVSSNTGAITLTGTGAPSNSASAGVLISGTANVQTVSSSIGVIGAGRGNAANPGVLFSATNAVTSTSGLITVQGTSTSSAAGSHGLSVTTHGWDAATTGTVTITNCSGGVHSNGASFEQPFTTGGDVVFSNMSASNNGSAIYISDTFDVPAGALVATDNIVSLAGPNTKGWTSVGAVTVQRPIDITASSLGISGAAVGITIGANLISDAEITLVGSGGPGDGPSHGIRLIGGAVSSTSSAEILLEGVAQGSGISYGIHIDGGTVSSATGTITLTGTSTATGVNAYGVSTLQALNMLTTGPVTFNGSSANSFAIRVGADLTTGGELTFSDSVAVGINTASTVVITNDGTMNFNSTIDGAYVGINSLTLNSQSGSVFIAGDVGATNRLASFIIDGAGVEFGSENIIVDSLDVQPPAVFTFVGTITINTSAAGGNIQFHSTVDGANFPDQDLVLTAGSGSILFDGVIGGIEPLGSFNVTSASDLTFGSNATDITVGSFNVASPVPTVFSAPLTTVNAIAGNISFGGTVDGLADDGSSSLTLSATGSVNLAASIGSTGRLGTLLIDQASVLNVGANVALIHVDTLNVDNMVATVLQGTNSTTLIDSGNVTFSGTVNGDNAQGHALTITSSGSILFGDAIGDMVPIGALNITSGTDLTFNSSTVTAASITVASPVPTTLAAPATNLLATTGAILFGGDILGMSDADFTAATTVTFLGDISAGDMTVTTAPSGLFFGAGTHAVVSDSFAVASGIATTLQGAGTLTITALGSDVNFGGTINGSNAGVHSLIISAAGDAIFNGNIGATTQLADFDITSGMSAQFTAAVSTIAANSVHIAPDMSIASALLTINTSVAGGNILIDGTINGTVVGANSLTLNAGVGNISFGDEIGTTTRLNNFTISSASDVIFGVNADTLIANSVTVLSAPVTLNAATTQINTSAANGNISFGSTIDSVGSMTLNAGSGNMVFSGAINVDAMTIQSATNVTAVQITASSLTQTTGLGTSTFNGLITLSGDLTLNGANFTFNAPVFADDASIQNSALLTINDDITLTGGFTQTGGQVRTRGDILAQNAIQIGAPVTLTGPVDITSNSANAIFQSTINGTYDLSVAGTNVQYLSTVGATDPLNSISTSATSITVAGSQSVFSGPMSYGGAVTLTASTTFTNQGSGAVSFSSSITGAHDLSIVANHASVTVNGAINTSAANGHPVTIFGGRGVSIGGNLSTIGTAGEGGAVNIYALNGSISVNNVYTYGTTNGGDIKLTPSKEISGGLPVGLITLNGNLNAGPNNSSGGVIILSANRAFQPTTATIVSSLVGNDVTITGRKVTMGIGEAFTVLGSLTFNSPSLTLGDLVALDDLNLNATVIQPNFHGDVTILNNVGGFDISPSLHFLAGQNYVQTGTVIPSGPLNAGVVPLSTSLLTFGSIILNYDQDANPPPPPPPPPFTPSDIIQILYLLDVADAQLSDDLPIYWNNFPPDYLQRRKAPQKEEP